MRRAVVFMLLASLAALLVGLGLSLLIWGKPTLGAWARASRPYTPSGFANAASTVQQVIVYDVTDIIDASDPVTSHKQIETTLMRAFPVLKHDADKPADHTIRSFTTGVHSVFIVRTDGAMHNKIEQLIEGKRQWAMKVNILEWFWWRVKCVCAVMLVNAWIAAAIYLWRKHLRVLNADLCRGCGYDLRESPVRCPECGRGRDGVAATLA